MNTPSKLKSTFLAFGMAAGAPAVAQEAPLEIPLAKTAERYFFVQLDSRWYDITPVSVVAEIIPDIGISIPDAQMQNCQDMGTPTPFRLWYGPNFNVVYEIGRVDYVMSYPGYPEAPVSYLKIVTRSGNVVCNGEVPNPVEPHLVFRDSLEGEDPFPAKVVPPLKAPAP